MHSSSFIFDLIFFILAGKENNHKSLDWFEFRRISPCNAELAALECVTEKSMYNLVSTLAPSFLIGSSSFLQVMRTAITSRMSLNFGLIRPGTAELAVLDCLKKFPYWTYYGENLVSTLEPSYLIGSFSFLQVTRTVINPWMSSNFGIIPPLTTEFAALEGLK